MKKITLLFLITLFIVGCDSKTDSDYSVEITNQKISICGKDKSIDDYTNNNTLDISALINDFEKCNEKLEEDKDFYKQNYINLAEDYNSKMQELGIEEYVLTDTSK